MSRCAVVGLLVCSLFTPTVAAGQSVPGPPTFLVQNVTGTSVRLSWLPPSTGVASIYIVHYNAIGQTPIQRPVGANLSLDLTGLAFGQYQWNVYACNGDLCGPAAYSGFTVGPVPGPPLDPRATPSGNTIQISWSAPVNSTFVAIDEYSVEVDILDYELRETHTVSIMSAPPITPAPPVSSFLLPTPVRPGSYSVRVRAKNVSGTSQPTGDVGFTVGPVVPFFPRNLRATVDGQNVSLEWNLRSDSPFASSFILEAGSRPGAADIANVDLGTSATSIRFLGVPLGTYYLRVRARNAAGISYLASNEVPIVVPQGGSCGGALDSPRSLSASAVGNFVTLSWLAPAIAARQLTSYIIQAGSAPGLTNLANFATGSPNTAIAGAVPAGTYYVRVRAQDVCGISGPSNEIVVVVP